ncbi:hypothetical protein GH733_009639 [Mirounga leonina]|nr:hypothetical protein GH733_009639 [Mirounga leonina]
MVHNQRCRDLHQGQGLDTSSDLYLSTAKATSPKENRQREEDIGLHFKWPLGAPMLAAVYAMSMVLKMLPALGMACPPKCRCEKLLFYCDSQGFRSVPNATDKGSLGLSLRHNHITELERDQFASFSQLTWLHLDHNQISTLSSLHPELFYGLRKLQTLHLRSNSLRTIPVRLFWDCRSLEFLDLSTNRLRSLARNGFAGLIKLRELHLEHNQLTKINFAHFLRLSSLHTLFLQWNKITNLTCGMEWTWGTLEKLDMTGNEIKAIDLTVFETMPNLKILLMDNNKLNSLDSKILNSLRSLTTVGLSGNLWECSPRICALASWLGSFQGRWEHSILCHSPDHTQGEDILDAVHGFQLCWNLSTTVTAMATTYRDPTTEYTKRISSSSYHVGDKEIPTTAGIAVTTEEHFPEPDNAIFTQRGKRPEHEALVILGPLRLGPPHVAHANNCATALRKHLHYSTYHTALDTHTPFKSQQEGVQRPPGKRGLTRVKRV